MSERYPFTTDRSLVPSLIINDNVDWDPNENIDYTTNNLTDTINDTYTTAVGENTQYLSVLDSTLDGLNVSMTNSKIEELNTFTDMETDEANDQQVVLFTVEGSDEYYGIQLAQDEDGNVRKYQFQFKQLENGQFEAIPETIQLLQDDLEEDLTPPQIVPTTTTLTDLQSQTFREISFQAKPNFKIFVAGNNENEQILPDSYQDDQSPEQETYQNEEEQITVMYENEPHTEILDDKTGLLQSIKRENINYYKDIKAEHPNSYYSEDSQEPRNIEYEEDLNEIPSFFPAQEDLQDEQIFEQEEEDALPEMSVADANYISDKDQDDTSSNTLIEEITIRREEEEEKEQEEEVEEILNDPELNQEFHQIDFQGITDYVLEKLPAEDFEQDKICNTTILKDALKAYKEQSKPKKEKLLYLIVQHPEKENVHSMSFDNKILQKPARNPRSILKTSHSLIDISKQQPTEYFTDERMNKRFSRGKEAVQARLFNNFINKTTIPQAPIRKDRLPRKQKIKPVERQDEEIIVKEVIVSSGGFVEPEQNLKNVENLSVTSYVELSDSDEEYNPKKSKQKKKKNQVLSDEEESDSSIINLDSDDENTKDDNDNNNKLDDDKGDTPSKRRRGRPPKSRNSDKSDKMVSQLESPMKKIRVDSSEDEKKSEIQCPKCPKSFPSQNSLKTHLQHHNLENSIRLRSRSTMVPQPQPSESRPKPVEYKYKCEKCESTFKNSILLTRHECSSKTTSNKKPPEKSQIIICPICRRKFPNSTTLNVHKRIHIKEQLIRSTENKLAVKISPKKFKSPLKINPAAKVNKSPIVKSSFKKLRSSSMLKRTTTSEKNTLKPPSVQRTPEATNKIIVSKTTPSRTLKTPNYKRRAPHGGIPVPPKLRNAFFGLKKKLQDLEDKNAETREEKTTS